MTDDPERKTISNDRLEQIIGMLKPVTNRTIANLWEDAWCALSELQERRQAEMCKPEADIRVLREEESKMTNGPRHDIVSDDLLAALVHHGQALFKAKWSVWDRDQLSALIELQERRQAAAEVKKTIAEVDRLHTWDGMLSILDEHWPEELAPTIEKDDPSRDSGVRIVSLLRWVSRLQSRITELKHALAEDDAYFNQISPVAPRTSRVLTQSK